MHKAVIRQVPPTLSWRGSEWFDSCSVCGELFLNEKQNVGTVVISGDLLQFHLEWQPKTLCLAALMREELFTSSCNLWSRGSVVVTCVCVINNVDGSLSQIYYSVHFKRSQVLLIQSDVSQKGNWNRQTEMAHVRRLWGNSTIWSISLSRPVASSFSCRSDWVGCMEAQSKHLWKAWSM